MQRPAGQLREDALKIWRAGVVAVGSARLVLEAVEIERNWLRLGEHIVDLRETERIAVVGGGKAAAGMAVALEQALGPSLLSEKAVAGWVNVPGDCLLETDAIQLHAARPAGLNEPTEDGVRGVQQMLRLVVGLGPQDVCVALISGGGSALMPAPVDGCSLADEIELTRALSEHGATIDQMNTVRRELSAVKGGKLAAACRARQMFSLIISDVLGDDLSLVASGPTVTRASTPDAAIEILQQFGLVDCPAAARAIDVLGRLKCTGAGTSTATPIANVSNILLANNATAVDAAGVEAERLGYSHAMIAANQSEGSVEDVAHGLVGMAKRMREAPGPDCLISGGEPTVRLAPAAARGKGGRNQQLCLAALAEQRDWQRLALIAGGTDGEDGPTDAAGACVDEVIAAEAARLGLDPQGYLARNDAYSFFERAGGLLKTGPTHTNVCDLRVITASR